MDTGLQLFVQARSRTPTAPLGFLRDVHSAAALQARQLCFERHHLPPRPKGAGLCCSLLYSRTFSRITVSMTARTATVEVDHIDGNAPCVPIMHQVGKVIAHLALGYQRSENLILQLYLMLCSYRSSRLFNSCTIRLPSRPSVVWLPYANVCAGHCCSEAMHTSQHLEAREIATNGWHNPMLQP